MASTWLDLPIPDQYFFVNAPECRTRREAQALFLAPSAVSSFTESKLFHDGDQVVAVLHEIFDPQSCNTILDRQVVLQQDSHVCKAIRKGKSNLNAEMKNLELVREQTSIPVPLVHGYRQSEEFEYLTMSKMRGDSLERVWGSLSNEHKESIADEVIEYISQLRQLKSWTLQVSIVDRSIMPKAITNVTELYLERYKPFLSDERIRSFVKDRCAALDRLPNVFTHSDLDWSNIFIQDGKVCGLIDFELSGFLPTDWEWMGAERMASRGHPWFQLLANRLAESKTPEWSRLWDLERLLDALKTHSQWALEPEDRMANQAQGESQVREILGIDDVVMPRVEYDPSKYACWLEWTDKQNLSKVA